MSNSLSNQSDESIRSRTPGVVSKKLEVVTWKHVDLLNMLHVQKGSREHVMTKSFDHAAFPSAAV